MNAPQIRKREGTTTWSKVLGELPEFATGKELGKQIHECTTGEGLGEQFHECAAGIKEVGRL